MPNRLFVLRALRSIWVLLWLLPGAGAALAAGTKTCPAFAKAQAELIAAQKEFTACAAKGKAAACKEKGKRVLELTKQLKGGPDDFCTPKPSVTSGLGEDVDKAIDQSPKFRAKIKELLAKGYTFEYGPAGQGSYMDPGTRRIVIDGSKQGDLESTVQTLAHEAGHPGYTFKETKPDGLTKAQYIEKNVLNMLAGEGEATLTNFELRDDLRANGGLKIDVDGNFPKEYEAIYQQYLKDKDRAKARAAIGKIFGKNEHPSTSPGQTYWDYYADWYGKAYDQWKKKNP